MNSEGESTRNLNCDEVDYATPEVLRLLEQDNEYNFFHEKRGRALIINNVSFQTGSGNEKRRGAEHDTRRLTDLFRNLDFDVRVHTNLAAKQIVEKIAEAASSRDYDHAKADCFLCAILSHGDDFYDKRGVAHDVIHGVDGEMILTRDIVGLLQDKYCPYLENKPKIFIFQACRGDDLDVGQEVVGYMPVGRSYQQQFRTRGTDEASGLSSNRARTYSDQSDDIMVSPTPLYKDFLVVYATPPGYSAWRGHQGSYYIQYLEEVFRKSHQEHVPLVKTLTRTSHRMAVLFQSNTKDSSGGKKQMPCIMSMLTKDICFRRKPVYV